MQHIVLQVAAEVVLAHLHVTLAFAKGAFGRIHLDHIGLAGAVGKLHVVKHKGLVPPLGRTHGRRVGGEVHVHGNAVGSLGVEIPPFDAAGSVVVAAAVLPGLYYFGIDAQGLEVLGPVHDADRTIRFHGYRILL